MNNSKKIIDRLLASLTKFTDIFRTGDDATVAKDAPSRRVRVRHHDLALIASAKRRARDAFFKTRRMNTRGLPLGLPLHAVTFAREVEKRARLGRTEGLTDDQIDLAERVAKRLEENAAARARTPRPGKLARRVCTQGTATASRMIAAQRARRRVVV